MAISKIAIAMAPRGAPLQNVPKISGLSQLRCPSLCQRAKPIKVHVDKPDDKRQRHSHKDNAEIKLNG